MFVKPGPNERGPGGQHVVRIPRTHELLPPEGREVPANRFWHRRLLAGDVVLVETPAVDETQHPAEGRTP
jgi:hypothetical protein